MSDLKEPTAKSPPWVAPELPTLSTWTSEVSLRTSSRKLAVLSDEPGPVEYDNEAPAYESEAEDSDGVPALPTYTR